MLPCPADSFSPFLPLSASRHYLQSFFISGCPGGLHLRLIFVFCLDYIAFFDDSASPLRTTSVQPCEARIPSPVSYGASTAFLLPSRFRMGLSKAPSLPPSDLLWHTLRVLWAVLVAHRQPKGLIS